jgi:branched-chain amino acid transport system ATP-binding protein
MLLEIRTLEAGYGDIKILWGVDIEIDRGELVALVGCNGAGKTTLLRTISGLLNASSGRITFDGNDITNKNPSEIVGMGISLVPEGRNLFTGLTVKSNIMLGAYLRRNRERIKEDYQRMLNLFPELLERESYQAGLLSGGEQQMLSIARALMANPKLLLIDEMSAGLAPVVVERLVNLVVDVYRESEVSILLVEQDVALALDLANRGYVMERGRIIKMGEAKDLLADGMIREAYLGI